MKYLRVTELVKNEVRIYTRQSGFIAIMLCCVLLLSSESGTHSKRAIFLKFLRNSEYIFM
jgi:hypothetical protein